MWRAARRWNAGSIASKFALQGDGGAARAPHFARSFLTIQETREYFPEYQTMDAEKPDLLGVDYMKLLNQELKDQSRLEVLLTGGEADNYCKIAEPLWKKVKKHIKGEEASRHVLAAFNESELDMTKPMLRGVMLKLLRNQKFYPGWCLANYVVKSKRFEVGEMDYLFQIAFAALAGCHRSAESVFANLRRPYRSKKAFHVYMAGSVLKRLNRVKLEDLLRELKEKGWYTDAAALNQMLVFHSQMPELRQRMPELFDEAKSFGVAPDVASYNLYIGFHCKEKDVNGMEEVYRMLGDDPSVEADESTHIILACGFLSVGCFDKAGKALVELEEKLASGKFHRKQSTYNKLLRLYGDTRDADGVEGIWSILSSRPLKAMESYCYAIEALGKTVGVHRAEEVFAQVDGLANTKLVISMLSVYTNYGYLNKAKDLFQNLPRKRMQHRLVIYKFMIAGYLRQNETRKALRMFTMGCTVLRDRCVSCAWERVVLDVLDHFANRGDVKTIDSIFFTNSSTLKHFRSMRVYRVVLKAYLNRRAPLSRFVDWTMRMGFSPDAETRELLSYLHKN